jgi:hypothetical protein
MPTVLEALGAYIDANRQDLTIGVNLFLSKMPDTPDVCVCIYETQGSAPIMTFGATAIQLDRPNVQISVRAGRDNYAAARDMAQTLRTLVAGIVNVTSSNVLIMRAEPTGSFYPLGVDQLERPRVVFNMDCHVVV